MIFRTQDASSTKQTPPQEAYVYPVRTAEQLITSQHVKTCATHIRKWTKCDDTLFHGCYLPLMHRYAEFVQCLPNQSTQRASSMLMVSLRRALLLIEAFAKHLVVTEGKMVLASDFGARVLFAVFSSALLFQVGKVGSGLRVELCSENGGYRAPWLLFEGPMTAYADYFKLRFGNVLPDTLLKPMTHVVARQIMPTQAMIWIGEDSEVLHRWFEGLNVVDAFFEGYRVELNVDELLQKDPLRLDEIEASSNVLSDQLEAEKFWHWLKEHIRQDAYANDHVLFVDGELVLDIEALIEWYVREFGLGDYAMVLAKQFNDLGITKMDGNAVKYQQYFAKSQDASASSGLFLGQRAHAGKARHLLALDAQASQFFFSKEILMGVRQRSGHMQAANQLTSGQQILQRLQSKRQGLSPQDLSRGA